MNFDDFIWKWYDVGCDFDGAYGFQCVDLYRQYCKEVLSVTQSPAISGAAKIWDTIDTNIFQKIPNTPTGVPQKGDIMIWNTKMGGGYGHVGIVRNADVLKFTSFDQNWAVGSPPKKVVHNYTNTFGWLRKKK